MLIVLRIPARKYAFNCPLAGHYAMDYSLENSILQKYTVACCPYMINFRYGQIH